MVHYHTYGVVVVQSTISVGVAWGRNDAVNPHVFLVVELDAQHKWRALPVKYNTWYIDIIIDKKPFDALHASSVMRR